MRKLQLGLRQNKFRYKQLIQIAGTVITKMTGNANFATPAPTLLAIQTAQTDLKNANALSGYKRSRGTKAQLIDTQGKAQTLSNLLLALLNYVLNTAAIAADQDTPDFDNIIISSGFATRSVRNIQPKAQIATFVRQSNNKLYPIGSNRVRWKRPLGLIKGARIAGYNIMVGGVIVQTTSKCSAIVPTPQGAQTEITIVPFNSRGYGNHFFATVKG